MARYAEGTTVPVEKTRAEIEATLSRFGATEFGYVTRPKGAVVEFLVRGRRVRFVLPLADRNDPKFARTPKTGKLRSGVESGKAWDADCRQRWRTLAIFLVTGFLASVASYVFGSPLVVGVGASGAIFGLAGAFIAYSYRRRGQVLANAQLQQALVFVALNVVLGFVIEGIDWRAHLGGLVAGLAAGWVADPGRPRPVRALVTVAGLAAIVAVGVAAALWRTDQLRELLGIVG